MNSSTGRDARTDISGTGRSQAHIGTVPRKGWETLTTMAPVAKVGRVGPAAGAHSRISTESHSTQALSTATHGSTPDISHAAATPVPTPSPPQHTQKDATHPVLPESSPSSTAPNNEAPVVAQSQQLHASLAPNLPVLPQSPLPDVSLDINNPVLTGPTEDDSPGNENKQVSSDSPPPISDFIPDAIPTNQTETETPAQAPSGATNREGDSRATEDDDEIINVDDLPDEIAHDGPSSRTRAASNPSKAAEKAKERADLETAANVCLSTAPATTSTGQPVPPGKIILTVRDMNDYTVEYLIRPTCPLSTMFENFLVHHIRMNKNDVRFFFDGERLCDIDTAAGKGMISGDFIDCFWSVSGGNTDF